MLADGSHRARMNKGAISAALAPSGHQPCPTITRVCENRKTYPRKVRGTAGPSTTLGMTRGRVCLPSAISCWCSETADPSASLGMTKRGGLLYGKGRLPKDRVVVSCQSAKSKKSQAIGMTRGREPLPWVGSVVEQKSLLPRQPLSMEAPNSPLSSRAQPRDLRFYGFFVDMFFGSRRGGASPFIFVPVLGLGLRSDVPTGLGSACARSSSCLRQSRESTKYLDSRQFSSTITWSSR